METKIEVFKGRKIRRSLHQNEWWFVVEDVVLALIDSSDPKQYIQRMKQRDPELAKGWVQFVHILLVKTEGGKQKMNCANTQGIFRIIQSIPSPKAEPFKRWLAKVGYERVKEIENPELAMERMRSLYEQKGYPKEWIDKRVRGIAVRQNLTKEWECRGAGSDIQYAILTNDIMHGAFGLKVEDYKKLKGLDSENLRDHMTDIELILTILDEVTTTKFTRERDTRGFPKLRKDAQDGGSVAGRTRRDIERRSGKPIVSHENFLEMTRMKALKKK